MINKIGTSTKLYLLVAVMSVFIIGTEISDRFNRMKQRNNILELQMGTCINCFKACPVYVFKESKYNGELALFIDVQEGVLNNIRICEHHKS
jgi:hypothetical protein